MSLRIIGINVQSRRATVQAFGSLDCVVCELNPEDCCETGQGTCPTDCCADVEPLETVLFEASGPVAGLCEVCDLTGTLTIVEANARAWTNSGTSSGCDDLTPFELTLYCVGGSWRFAGTVTPPASPPIYFDVAAYLDDDTLLLTGVVNIPDCEPLIIAAEPPCLEVSDCLCDEFCEVNNQFSFNLAGITNAGLCTNCDVFNRTHVLNYKSTCGGLHCIWAEDNLDTFCPPATPPVQWYIAHVVDGMTDEYQLRLVQSCFSAAAPGTPAYAGYSCDGDFDPTAANSFTKIWDDLICSGLPDTITVTPSGDVIDCPCPEPTYNCVDGSCVDPGDGSGTYTGPDALEDCEEACEPPESDIVFVQANSASFGDSASARALAYTSSVVAGNELFVAVGGFSATPRTVALTDTQGNTYTQVGGYSDQGNNRLSLWRTVAGSSGANTVTVTPSGSQYSAIVTAEYSGVNATPVDTVVTAGAGSTTSLTTGSVAVGQVGTMVIGVFAQGFVNATGTATGGFTMRTQVTTGATDMAIYFEDILGQAAAIAATATVTSAAAYAAIGVSIKPV